MRNDRRFGPVEQKQWYPASYYPSPLYNRNINEISLEDEQDDSHEHKSFSYNEADPNGPSNWGLVNRNCVGKNQSPVNLYEATARSDEIRKPLIIDKFNDIPNAVTVFNNGHSAGLRFNFTSGPIRLLGGPLTVPYILDNVHWHWGDKDTAGSEHTINSQRYSAEVHFVFFSSVYGKTKNNKRDF